MWGNKKRGRYIHTYNNHLAKASFSICAYIKILLMQYSKYTSYSLWPTADLFTSEWAKQDTRWTDLTQGNNGEKVGKLGGTLRLCNRYGARSFMSECSKDLEWFEKLKISSVSVLIIVACFHLCTKKGSQNQIMLCISLWDIVQMSCYEHAHNIFSDKVCQDYGLKNNLAESLLFVVG